jgi:hypothetical protein
MSTRFIRMAVAALATAALVSPAGIAAAAGQNDSGGNQSEAIQASQTVRFQIPNAAAKATLTYNAVNTHVVRFDTKDVGLPGDRWRVSIQGSGRKVSGPCGSGSTSNFSGVLKVTVTPGTYTVRVSLCRGVGVFPAGGILRARN